MVVLLAVSKTITFEETLVAQFGVALGASKVLRVEDLAQCRHNLTHDGSATGTAIALGGRVDAVSVQIRFEIADHRVQIGAIGVTVQDVTVLRGHLHSSKRNQV